MSQQKPVQNKNGKKQITHDENKWSIHLCYKTDFLFAKSQGPQSYFTYTLLNTQWTFCASMRPPKKIGAFFIYLHFQKIIFCVQL